MGLLSILGKIGGVAAAPFTGGASLIPTIAGIAGDVGSVLGKQQQGKTQGQITQAQLQQAQDRNALDRYQTQQGAEMSAGNLDLNRKAFEQASRSGNAKQALIGALLGGGAMPTSVKGGDASGGLFRSLLSNPEALAAMKALSGQASEAQQTPLSFAGGKVLDAPSLTALPKIDSGGFLSGLANALQIGGAIGSSFGGGAPASPIPNVPLSALSALPGTPFDLTPPKKNYVVTDDDGDGSNR